MKSRQLALARMEQIDNEECKTELIFTAPTWDTKTSWVALERTNTMTPPSRSSPAAHTVLGDPSVAGNEHKDLPNLTAPDAVTRVLVKRGAEEALPSWR